MALRTVQRFDRGELRKSFRRPDGSRHMEGVAVRAGVMLYRNADGTTHRELIPLSTIKATSGGLARLPLTLEHPPEFVTPDNVQRFQVGDTDGSVEVVEESEEEGYVVVKMTSRARKVLDALDDGLDELSPGYEAQVDFTPGTHPVFGPYDAVQTGRTYNHLAAVKKGRGDRVKLRADSAVQVVPGSGGGRSTRTRHDTMKIKLLALASSLGVTRLDAADEDLVANITEKVTALKADADEATAEAEGAKADKDAADAKLADMQKQLDAMKAERDTYKDELEKMKADMKAAKDMEAEKKADALAATLGVKLDGCEGLRAKRLAIAKARLDVSDDIDDATLGVQIGVLEKLHGGESREDSAADPNDKLRLADRFDSAEGDFKPGGAFYTPGLED